MGLNINYLISACLPTASNIVLALSSSLFLIFQLNDKLNHAATTWICALFWTRCFSRSHLLLLVGLMFSNNLRHKKFVEKKLLKRGYGRDSWWENMLNLKKCNTFRKKLQKYLPTNTIRPTTNQTQNRDQTGKEHWTVDSWSYTQIPSDQPLIKLKTKIKQ